jgi:hypothetical protein
MAKSIVEVLETVHVHHDKRNVAVFSCRLVQLTHERLFHVATVKEPCERIPNGLIAKDCAGL